VVDTQVRRHTLPLLKSQEHGSRHICSTLPLSNSSKALVLKLTGVMLVRTVSQRSDLRQPDNKGFGIAITVLNITSIDKARHYQQRPTL
jgi:hypothetical protein